ncbi:MAG: hypothetical protein UV43_C0029G0008 [Parcubacteria group bacterium GW2011_GWF2_42_7]|nr:MAG: hypothetical protein UV43_C0029G0008 [Parcubacteria group bacterium GW2011_GWF2_42_7]
MNPKNIFLTTIILMAFLILAVPANAAELPSPGATPDSPLYFLKTWKESIQTFFIFGFENKAKQYLHLADVRLAEYQKMIDKGKTKIAEKTLVKYEKQLYKAIQAMSKKKKAKDILPLLKDEPITEKHIGILEENLQKVPGAGKKGIEKALETLRKLKGAKKDETVNWQTYRNEELKFEFKYPKELDKQFISVVSESWPSWPPKMTIGIDATETDFMCEENPNYKDESGYGERERVKINNAIYCVTSTSGAAAGTKYVNYTYLTIKNSKFITLTFVLSYPNCSNFGEDNKLKKCEAEQKAFDPNKLADQILSTFKFISQ